MPLFKALGVVLALYTAADGVLSHDAHAFAVSRSFSFFTSATYSRIASSRAVPLRPAHASNFARLTMSSAPGRSPDTSPTVACL